MSSEYMISMARAITYAAGLRADDQRFNQDVEVRHHDGSLWYLRSGFMMPDPQNPKWLWVITEHFGEMVFDTEDVEVHTFDSGPRRDYRYHESCEDHGYTHPLPVECPCGDCKGFLNQEDVATGLLICSACKCAYRERMSS